MQKLAHDKRAKGKELTVGQDVMAMNYRDGDKWMPGTVIERKGPFSYIVQMETGAIWRRHIDQLREGTTSTVRPSSAEEIASFPYDVGEPSSASEPAQSELDPE